MKLDPYKKGRKFGRNFFLFDFSLYYNRGISVVCLKKIKCVSKFFKNLAEKDFFPTL
jgi:hypothetical protein